MKTPATELLKAAIGEVVTISPSALTNDAWLMSDLGLESIDIVDLSFRLEKKVKTEFTLIEWIQRQQMTSPTGRFDAQFSQIVAFLESHAKG